jgi:hypothetical protein
MRSGYQRAGIPVSGLPEFSAVWQLSFTADSDRAHLRAWPLMCAGF